VRRLLQVILFLIIVIFAAGAVFAMLPLAKEGTDFTDLPAFLGVAVTALVLAALWWLAVRHSLRKSLVPWIILAIPLMMHAGMAYRLIAGRLEAQRFEETAKISDYGETPIEWPGFDGPVGLRISFKLHHEPLSRALILPPEIRMAPSVSIPRDKLHASQTSGAGYFKDTFLPAPQPPYALLKSVLFQRVFENALVSNPNHKWLSSISLRSGTTTELTFNLLPGTIDFMPSTGRIYLAGHTAGIPLCAPDQKPETGCASRNRVRVTEPMYAKGGDLTASWLIAGPDVIDVSPQLTQVLRAGSSLQNHPEAWTAMQKQLEPDGLAKAGYSLCPPGEDSHTAFRVCYCRTP